MMSVTFLGTSSGGGPSESRNCSSLVCDVLGDGSLWMVDCAEGTLRQFSLQPYGNPHLKANRVTKLFITHMHADHIMGIVPLLRNLLHPPPPAIHSASFAHPEKSLKIEIYGPSGIRIFVRQIMKMTYTNTLYAYTVHELLTSQDPLAPCHTSDISIDNLLEQQVMHCSELPGCDIRCSPDGLWRSLTQSQGVFGQVFVDAGPILHRDPCIGYIIRESSGPRRKLVILGDTHDPSFIIPLCLSPPPSLLIHEATDAHIPRNIDPKSRRPAELVSENCLARGHSMPAMAGAFAKNVGAERLVLNHIGARFPAPRNSGDARAAVIREIEEQATKSWGSNRRAIAACDFMRVVIGGAGETEPMDLGYADPVEGILYIRR